jgi:hypothetical protein
MNDPESNAPQSQDSNAKGPTTLPKQYCPDHVKPATPWWKRLTSWQFVFEILIFIVTVRIAWIYSDQLDAMLKANFINKNAAEAATTAASVASQTLDELKKSDRAYLFVKTTQLRNPKSDTPVVIFEVSNQGRTPAIKVTHQVQMSVCKYPLPPGYEFRDTGSVNIDAPLYSGSPENFIAAMVTTKQARDLMTLPDHRFCGYGIVKYETMGEAHYSHFCYILGGLVSDMAEHCPTHNDSD